MWLGIRFQCCHFLTAYHKPHMRSDTHYFNDCIVNSTIYCNLSSIFPYNSSPALALCPILFLDFLWISVGIKSNPFHQNPERGWGKLSEPVRHLIDTSQLVSIRTGCRHITICSNRHIIEGGRIFLSQSHFLLLSNSGCTLIYSNYFSSFYSPEFRIGLATKKWWSCTAKWKQEQLCYLWSSEYTGKTNSIPLLSLPKAAIHKRQNSSFLGLSQGTLKNACFKVSCRTGAHCLEEDCTCLFNVYT